MGWRFRKTIHVGKFFRINLSKSGVGWSAGIPGTGVSYGVSPRRWTDGSWLYGCLILGAVGVVALMVFASFGKKPDDPVPPFERRDLQGQQLPVESLPVVPSADAKTAADRIEALER